MEVTKSVTVAKLTENLQEHLAEVREGTTIEVLDNDERVVVANIVPPEDGIQYPTSNLRTGDIKPGPRPKNLRTSSLRILLEDRHGSDEEYE